jgi:hypothetical protein
VEQTALLFEDRLFPRERQPDGGKKDEIVAERHARAVARALAHAVAKSAIERAVILIFAKSKFLRVGLYVSQHDATSPIFILLYDTAFPPKKQGYFAVLIKIYFFNTPTPQKRAKRPQKGQFYCG